jgi:predicted nucleotidyltransferase
LKRDNTETKQPDVSPDTITYSEEIRSAIQRILLKLIAGYTPQKVILFGSQAYGAPDRDSDIDLLIIKETAGRFIDRWVEVQRILAGTHRGLAVDTFVLTPLELENRLAIGDQFMSEILKNGEVLYNP